MMIEISDEGLESSDFRYLKSKFGRVMKKILILAILGLVLMPFALFGQQLANERALHQQILKDLRNDIKDNYYDTNFRGVDLDATIKNASEFVSAAKSLGEMDDAIARVLIQFDDSHLVYYPPPRTITVMSLEPLLER